MSDANNDIKPAIAPVPIKLEDNMEPEVKTYAAVAPSNPKDDEEEAELEKQLAKMETWRNRVFEGVEHATNERKVLENNLSWAVEFARKLLDENKELLLANKKARNNAKSSNGLHVWARIELEASERMYLDEKRCNRRNLEKIEVLTQQVKQLEMELRNEKKRKVNESPIVNTNK
jgi:hypothetical protein